MTGALTAGGTAILRGPVATVTLPGGTFKVSAKGKSTQNFNKATCLFTVTAHGPYRLGHGTGKYAGISGSGKATSACGRCPPVAGACTMNGPLALQQILSATGPCRCPSPRLTRC